LRNDDETESALCGRGTWSGRRASEGVGESGQAGMAGCRNRHEQQKVWRRRNHTVFLQVYCIRPEALTKRHMEFQLSLAGRSSFPSQADPQ